jgi:hypothetical protein
MRNEDLYRQALEDLKQSNLMPTLINAASELVPSVPEHDADLPRCPVCAGILCGACHACHDRHPGAWRSACPVVQEKSWACVIWFQAYKAVRDVQRRIEQWSDW